MEFEVDGGIEWYLGSSNGLLVIKPADNPESGYTSGQMKNYTNTSVAPWGKITEDGYSLSIEGGVISVGNFAFKSCTSFTTVTIPDSVISIGDDAFQSCSSLSSITIPDSVTIIGSYAFNSCSSLSSITIPSNITAIDTHTFSYCTSLTTVMIPNRVTSINMGAFTRCSSLTEITIPDSVTTIGDSAFSYTSLETVTIPNRVTSISGSAFGYCTSLTEITIPSSVTSIGGYVFENCKSLTRVVFLGNQPTLGYRAFYLNNSSPAITYDIYTNGWANTETFPEYEFTKWNYISSAVDGGIEWEKKPLLKPLLSNQQTNQKKDTYLDK